MGNRKSEVPQALPPSASPDSRFPVPDSLLLFYGGTFDPVHDGHLAIARAARDALDCMVRLVPAADPPHRAPPGADAIQRAAMLDLAIAGEPRLCVDRRELLRDGPSYTVETLRGLRADYGAQAPIAWLVGADSLIGLPTWREWQALFGLAHFVVAERPGFDLDAALPPVLAEALADRWTGAAPDLRANPAGRVFRLRQPLHAGSATDVRDRIAAGDAWEPLVPVAVAGHIRRHGLYGVPLHGVPTPPPL